MQKDSQTLYPHPGWKDARLAGLTAAWYEREITVPDGWAGRRIALAVEYLNSYAAVFVDGKQAGEIRFPGGEVDLTAACRPGGKHVLSLLVVAMPLKGVMLSYTDTASAREVQGHGAAARAVRRRLPRRHARRRPDRRREGRHVGAQGADHVRRRAGRASTPDGRYTLRARIVAGRPRRRRVHEQAVRRRTTSTTAASRSPRTGSRTGSGTSTRRRTCIPLSLSLLDADGPGARHRPRTCDSGSASSGSTAATST